MEVIAGRITNVTSDGLTIFVPYGDMHRYILRQYDEVQVGLPDGRTISPEQRRKAYALMGEIAAWAGMEPEEVKLTLKWEYVNRHMEGLQKTLFSLSNCDMTTAREYVDYLVDFCLTFDVPVQGAPLVSYCEDVTKYVYACLMHKRCAVCGKPCDLHHADRVGMGRSREAIDHIGMRCLPLCREHHQEAHRIGDGPLMDKYHLEAIPIDDKIKRLYSLGRRKGHEQTDYHRESDPSA